MDTSGRTIAAEIGEREPSYASDRSPLLGPNHSHSALPSSPTNETSNSLVCSNCQVTTSSRLGPSMGTSNPSTLPIRAPPPIPSSPAVPAPIPRASINQATPAQLAHSADPALLGLMYSNVVLVIELIITLAQITASVVVLAISWDTTRKSPLDGWIIGYTVGCVATLPLLYWRYRHRYVRQPEQPVDSLVSFSRVSLSPSAVTSTPSGILHSGVSTSANTDGVGDGSSRDLSSASGRSGTGGGSSRIDDSRFRRAVGASGGVPSLETVIAMDGRQRVVFSRLHDDTRLVIMVERFKILLDGFFAVWFVVGNVWMFGNSRDSGHADSVYWLCLVFLVFSFIGYAMPFILCATICCCLPCIIALMGYTEEPMAGKGAAQETITRLPIYKFHSSAPDPEDVPVLRPSGQQGRGAGRAETGDIEAGKDSDSDSESVPVTGGFLVDSSAKKPVSAEDAMCCICLGRYTEGVELRLLPCDHHFHVPCVDTWLKINAICPLCKKEIVSQDTPVASSSAESPQGSGGITSPNASRDANGGSTQHAAPGSDNRRSSNDAPTAGGRDSLDVV